MLNCIIELCSKDTYRSGVRRGKNSKPSTLRKAYSPTFIHKFALLRRLPYPVPLDTFRSRRQPVGDFHVRLVCAGRIARPIILQFEFIWSTLGGKCCTSYAHGLDRSTTAVSKVPRPWELMKLEYTATLELSLVSQLLRPGSVFLQSKRASSGMGIKCFLSFGGHHWLHERGRG